MVLPLVKNVFLVIFIHVMNEKTRKAEKYPEGLMYFNRDRHLLKVTTIL